MIVTDASVVLDVLLGTSRAAAAAARLLGGDTLHAPHLLDLEVAQVLRRYERAGSLSAQLGATALADLSVLPIERYPHEPFLPRIWELRHNATAYDACYLALAEVLNATLLTSDRRLAEMAGRTVRVEVIA